MLWDDFKEQVRVFLHVHNRRQGIQTLIDSLLKAAVLDMQSSIPELRKGNETTIGPSAFAEVGMSAVYQFGPAASITDLYTQSIDDPTLLAYYTQVPLTNIPQLREGTIQSGQYLFAYDPASGTLTLSPKPSDNNADVIVTWDSQFAEYSGTDDVPFNLVFAEAVAAYILSSLAAQVDNNPAESERQATAYRRKKRRIYTDFAESGSIPCRTRRGTTPVVPAGNPSNGEFNSDFNSDFN